MHICLGIIRLDRNLGCILFAVLMCVQGAQFAFAGQNPTLEERETSQAFDQSLLFLDQVKSKIEKLENERKHKCLRALGQDAFCQCLRAKLAIDTSFEQYVFALTVLDSELKTKVLKPDTMKLIENRVIRNQCVSRLK